MSQVPGVFGIEQITVTSGLDGTTPITLRNYAWAVLETRGLSIPQILIDNRNAPGGKGSTALAGAELEVRTSLPLQMSGGSTPAGDPYDDPRVGLRRNWILFAQHLILPSVDGPLDAVYQSIDPDEDPIDFGIQFSTSDIPTASATEWTCSIAVVLHGGALIPAAGS